jgi:hypothetical protein
MQVVTLLGVGTLRTLAALNLVLALAAVAFQARRGRPSLGCNAVWRAGVPWVAWVPLAGVVLALNIALPLEAADLYHLDRIAQIERFGTLAYATDVDPKVNIVGWVYELVLADLHQVPVVGDMLVRLHGVFGLLLYVAALGAMRSAFLPGGARWPWAVLLVVPPAFHQLVLVKNDLFLAVPALLALAWVVRGPAPDRWREIAWAGWLAGLAVAGKVLTFPVALVLLAATVAGAAGVARLRAVAALALGGVAGGLFYSWIQNARWYGDPLANQVTAEMGNVSTSVGGALAGAGRFALSLADMGQLTPVWWPGRGGWGGTFGLPLIWAAAVLAWRWRVAREARVALLAAAACFAVLGLLFLDADLSHRLVLAPGLLVVAVAAQAAAGTGPSGRWDRLALVPVLALSAAQILRSAVLYFGR